MKKLTLTLALSLLAVMGGQNAYAQAEFDFSKGKNYYLIYLDEETSSQIPAANIAGDYRVDDFNHWLYIWDGTYQSNDAIGPNSNGVPGAFIDYTVTNVGWSGFGFASVAPGKNLSGIDNSYYFHIALKSMGTENHMLIVSGEDKKEAKLNIGATPFNDNGVNYDPYDDFARDGEWAGFDIPVSTLTKLGASFSDGFTGNVFAMLSGGKQGTNICIDAIFFYQSMDDSGIDGLTADDVQVFVTPNTLSVAGIESGIELYDISGKLIRTSESNTMGVDDVCAGIYIVRVGNIAKKVSIQ